MKTIGVTLNASLLLFLATCGARTASAAIQPNTYTGGAPGWYMMLWVNADGAITAYLGGSVGYSTSNATAKSNGTIVVEFAPEIQFNGWLRNGRTEMVGRLRFAATKEKPSRVLAVRLAPRYLPMTPGIYSGWSGGNLDGYLLSFSYFPEPGYSAEMWFP